MATPRRSLQTFLVRPQANRQESLHQTNMANEEYLEMTVAEGSDLSTSSKQPNIEQTDEIIFHQTESRSSGKGLIEVCELQKFGYTTLTYN